MAAQTFSNHRKYVFGYHVVAYGLIGAALVIQVRSLMRGYTVEGLVPLFLTLALGLVAYYARFFAVKVQDRVIRMEEQIRFARLVPSDLNVRVNELRSWQYVALRFASDQEIAALVRRTLDGEFADAGAIKAAIKTWRPDYARA